MNNLGSSIISSYSPISAKGGKRSRRHSRRHSRKHNRSNKSRTRRHR